MNHLKKGTSWRRDAETSFTSSETSLSEDTEQILSSWKRLVQRHDLPERRDAAFARHRQAEYGAAPLAASPREAALRRPSSFPYGTWPIPVNHSSSSECNEDDTDASEVSLTTSLCYAALVVATALLALSTAVVLVRLVPGTSESASSRNAAQGSRAHNAVPSSAMAPPPAAKTTVHATAPNPRGEGLLHAVGSITEEEKEQVSNTSRSKGEGSSGNNTMQHPRGLPENLRTTVPPGGENSDDSYHHLCDIVFYTHCPRTAREFYFNGATNSCARATTSYGTEVCNRSPNRFASRASCEKSCVHVSHPSGRCLDRPVFSQCRSADLKRSTWFFEGETCQPWDFPSGRCPMADGDLFGSRQACIKKCVNNQTYLPLCRTPPSGTCSPRHLKFPYFAAKLPGSPKMRCLKTAALGLQKRLCLTGTNRFSSLGSCKRTCGHDVGGRRRN
ncbi:uncharacterized protein [Dermacentor albipictus]|uniref:uncharacterized protein n=1 Tax=Dermacentor albipictus TaxID=60249 RepID=UPI0031FC7373